VAICFGRQISPKCEKKKTLNSKKGYSIIQIFSLFLFFLFFEKIQSHFSTDFSFIAFLKLSFFFFNYLKTCHHLMLNPSYYANQ
jgi:hypothetical protein